MVITINMKNVIKRGQICYFRMGVPEDCREGVGRAVEAPVRVGEQSDSIGKRLGV
jgi:hypothetical protein